MARRDTKWQSIFGLIIIVVLLVCVFMPTVAASLHFGDSRTIWRPRFIMENIADDISKQNNLPQSRDELLQVYPKVKDLNIYGYWCYYKYDDNFYLVGQFQKLWFVFNRYGELDRSYNINSLKANGMFLQCDKERWWKQYF